MNDHASGPDNGADAPPLSAKSAATRSAPRRATAENSTAGVATSAPAAPRRAPARRAKAPATAPPAEQIADAVAGAAPVATPDPAAPDAAATPAPPRITVPAKPVRPKDSARLAVQRHLATHGAALLEQEARVRADAPDSVHKMRVAARRLRSGLKTFRPLLDDAWSRDLAEELRWLATSLGAMRDREVLLARLERDIAALPSWAATEVTLATVRTEMGRLMDAARGDALEALDSPRYAALVTKLVAAAEDPPTTKAAKGSCTKALLPLVDKAFRRLADEAAHLRLDPPQVQITAESDDAWHEARITAKKARYAAEACEPIFGKPASALVGQLTRVTETLGEHQDAAVAAEQVVAIGQVPGIPQQAALTLGVLHGVQREAVRAARAEFVGCWPEVSAKKWRSWL